MAIDSDVETSLVTTEFASREAVLEAVRRYSPRVRFLPECERLCAGLTSMFRSPSSFVHFAASMHVPRQGSRAKTTIVVPTRAELASSAVVRAAPSGASLHCAASSCSGSQGETEQRFFGDHAKVGESTRIHFFVLDSAEGRPDASKTEREVTIWVGRIDKHPK